MFVIHNFSTNAGWHISGNYDCLLLFLLSFFFFSACTNTPGKRFFLSLVYSLVASLESHCNNDLVSICYVNECILEEALSQELPSLMNYARHSLAWFWRSLLHLEEEVEIYHFLGDCFCSAFQSRKLPKRIMKCKNEGSIKFIAE